MKKLTIIFVLVLMYAFANSQTADEIIQKHIEKTGGIKAWEAVESIKMTTTITNQSGEPPITIKSIFTKDGSIYSVMEVADMKFVQIAFDGETAWGSNPQTMKAEKKDEKEIENLKHEAKEFPSQYINYKAKGVTIKLLGEQNIEGIDCYKLKLITAKKNVKETEVDNTTIVFISKENYFEIASEEENISRHVYSDHKKVNGVIMPYSITQSVQGQVSKIKVLSYEINSKIDKSIFEFKSYPKRNSVINTTNDNDEISKKNIIDKAQSIENKTIKIYDKLIKSTVKILSGGCGVLISEDGYILTAGHVIYEQGIEMLVKLHDGRIYNAIALGKDEKSDYGLLKIKEKGNWEWAELGSSTNLAKNETCLMFGYPGVLQTDNKCSAIVRIGFVKGIRSDGFLQTTCIMMPGDSGGPLFDLNGKVIGINSMIDIDVAKNFFAPIDKIKENWKKLVKGEFFNKGDCNASYQEYGESLHIKEAKSQQTPFVLKKGKNGLIKAISFNAKNISKSVVNINSLMGGEKINVYGTIVNSDGLIISKSSRIGDSQIRCELDNGEKITAKVLGRNEANDLVLLKIKTSATLYPIDLNKKVNFKVCQLLGTVKNKGQIILAGILSVLPKEIKGLAPKEYGYLGVQLDTSKLNPVIEKVIKGKAAEKAGLKNNDKIIKINTTPIKNQENIIGFLRHTKPNQKIIVHLIRNNKEKEIEVILGNSSKTSEFTPSQTHQFFHPADATDVNKRNDEFQCAFRHDMPLYVNECGTPVVTLSGEVIGINIARLDRTGSFAISIVKVAEVVREIIGNTTNN